MEIRYTQRQYYIIGFSSLILSLLGLLASFKTYKMLSDQLIYNMQSSNSALFWYLKPLYLMMGFKKSPFDVYEVFILLMLFVGSINFFIKKDKDTRLVSFAFSLILISNFVLILNHIFFIIKRIAADDIKISSLTFLSMAVGIGYFILSYYILKIIQKTKVLDVTENDRKISIKDTPKIQRFFHFMIDTLIMLLVFFPFLGSIFEASADNKNFRTVFANEFVGVLIILVLRMIFYPFFEIIFSATPAKFLTESRVINYLGKKPAAGNILGRTLCRSIPLNPFSFFWKNGWHDMLSNTYVVKEKRTGFKASYLLFFLFAFIPYISYYYFGQDLVNEWKRSQEYKLSKEITYQFNGNSIKNINSDQAYVLNQLGWNDDYQVIILKVEKVEGERIICKKIIHPEAFSTNYFSVQDFYRKQKDTAEIFTLNRKDFVNAAPKDLGENNEDKRNGSIFFKDGKKYEIAGIYTLSSPELDHPEYWVTDEFRRNSEGIIIKNNGKSGRILLIKNLEGNIKWTDTFPLTLKNSREEQNIYLKAENVPAREYFSFEILVEDSLKHHQRYRIDRVEHPYPDFNIYRYQ